MSSDPLNPVLAEIITSEKVGGVHLYRVGEVLISRERMNKVALERKAGRSSRPVDVDFIERLLEAEEACCDVWQMCKDRGREWRFQEGLLKLDQALRVVVEFYDELAERL